MADHLHSDARDLDAALYSRAYSYPEGREYAGTGYAPRSLEDFELYVRDKHDTRPPRPMPPKKPTRTYSVVFPPDFHVPHRRFVRWD